MAMALLAKVALVALGALRAASAADPGACGAPGGDACEAADHSLLQTTHKLQKDETSWHTRHPKWPQGHHHQHLQAPHATRAGGHRGGAASLLEVPDSALLEVHNDNVVVVSDDAPPFPKWTIALYATLLVASCVVFVKKILEEDDVAVPVDEDIMHGMNDGQVLAKLKDMELTAAGRVCSEMCLRAAIFALIAALARIVPDLYAWVSHQGWAPGTMVAFLVFNFNPSFGATLVGVTNALLGTAMALLYIWLPMQVFPEGASHDSPDTVWYAGVGWLVFTVTFTLFANFPDGVKVWCLLGHVGNMMSFLHPPAGGISGVVPATVGSTVLMCVGAMVTMIATCLPFPFMESRKAIAGLRKTTVLFRILLNDVVCAYTGDGVTPFDKGAGIAAQLRASIDALGASADASWFEHFDWCGYTRHSLLRHKNVMQKLLYHVSCIQKAMGGGWTAQSTGKEEVLALQEKIDNMLWMCVEVIEGKRDTKSITEVEAVEVAINALPTSAGDSNEASTVIFLLHSLADSAKDYGSLVSKNVKDWETDYVYWSVICYFLRALGLRDTKWDMVSVKEHVNSSMRYVITMLLCFALGYNGYPPVVQPFQGGIAVNAAFLIGSVPGSALVGNLKKFQGIVLGTAGGQLIYPIIHAASGLGPAVIGAAVFIFIYATSMIKFSSADFALVGMLLGVFGSGQMLAPPGASDCDLKCVMAQLAGAYQGIIMAVISILTMTVVDLILAQPLLGKEDPKLAAINTYKSFLDTVEGACLALLGQDKGDENIKGFLSKKDKAGLLAYIEGMSGKLSTMDSLSDMAFASHAEQDFNVNFNKGLASAGRSLLDDLWVLASSVASQESPVQKDDLAKSFSNMFGDIHKFLESSDAKGGKGILMLESVTEGFELVQKGKEAMVAADEPGAIEDPVMGYAVKSMLGFKNTVWSASKSTAV